MLRLMLVSFILLFFPTTETLNPVCDQKALNRKARNYAEVVLKGETVDKGTLIGSLQFLSEDTLRKPMIAILENESMFFGLCEWMSTIESASSFLGTCKEVFSEVGQLKKVQLSMLLSTMLSLIPRPISSTASGLEKLIVPPRSSLKQPID